MACWPVYIVGGFFVSLLLADIANYSWDVLPYHAGLGICFTGLYYLFCVLFGNDISMAVLFVPAVFILMFFLASWLLFNSMKTQNCCMTCSGPSASPASASSTSASSASASSTSPSSKGFSDFWKWLFGSSPVKPKCPPKAA